MGASLLQSAKAAPGDDGERDWYWTLLSYFNSLRELGGALVLMQDDVNDGIRNIARRRSEDRREPRAIEELTSRRTQEQVRDMLDTLSIKAGEDGVLDAVLATNMVSVGVDIPRLGLMLVNGQPKGIAEYIQATSRIGRGKVPGLVVAVLNNGKARDRSHYESFATWHGTLYRDVEPTSVTPFASRARDRALHAVLVALVRHLVPGMVDRPRLDDAALEAAGDLVDHIVRRGRGRRSRGGGGCPRRAGCAPGRVDGPGPQELLGAKREQVAAPERRKGRRHARHRQTPGRRVADHEQHAQRRAVDAFQARREAPGGRGGLGRWRTNSATCGAAAWS